MKKFWSVLAAAILLAAGGAVVILLVKPGERKLEMLGPVVEVTVVLQAPMSIAEARQRVRDHAGTIRASGDPRHVRMLAGAEVFGVDRPTGAEERLHKVLLVQCPADPPEDEPELDLSSRWNALFTRSNSYEPVIRDAFKATDRDRRFRPDLVATLTGGTWLSVPESATCIETDADFGPVDTAVALPSGWRLREDMSLRYRPFVGGVRLFFDKLTPALRPDEIKRRVMSRICADVSGDLPEARNGLDLAVFPHGEADREGGVVRFEVVARSATHLHGARRVAFVRRMSALVRDALSEPDTARFWPGGHYVAGTTFSVVYRADLAGDREFQAYTSGLRDLLEISASTEFSDAQWQKLQSRHERLKDALGQADSAERRAALKEQAKAISAETAADEGVVRVHLQESSRDYRHWQRLRRRCEDFGGPGKVLGQLVGILRSRVDPDGTSGIQWRVLPPKRIEIILPPASSEASAAAGVYDEALAATLAAAPESRELAALLETAPAERGPRVESLLSRFAQFRKPLTKVIELHDQWRATASRPADAAARKAFFDAFDRLYPTRAAVQQAVGADPTLLSDQRDAQGRRMTWRALALRDLGERYPHHAKLAARAVVTTTAADAEVEAARRQKRIFDYLAFTWQRYVEAKGARIDPSDLQRLLRGSGQLQFAITVAREEDVPEERALRDILKRRGLAAANDYSPDFKWYKVRKAEGAGVDPFQFTADGRALFIRENVGGLPKRYRASRRIMMDGERVLDYEGGVDYILCHNTLEKTLDDRTVRTWWVTRAGRTTDRRGFPAVRFHFDAVGASYFGLLTGSHKGQQMAVILDGEIYSAPTIQERIADTGILTGQFTAAEQGRIIRTLTAGMLPARLIHPPEVRPLLPR